MIDAHDHEDAMREAARSTWGYSPDPAALEVWDGAQYVKAFKTRDGGTP